MKLFSSLFVFLAVPLIAKSISAHEDPFERLVYWQSPMETDVGPDPGALLRTPGWMASLGSYPDVNERLLALIERDFANASDPGVLSFPLYALATRKDLTSQQLDRFTARLEALGKETRKWTWMEENFLCGALPVLRNYPSSKHEEIATRFLDDASYTIGYQAMQVLAEIGTRESLEAARESLRKRPVRNVGPIDQARELIVSAFNQFEQRLASDISPSTPTKQEISTSKKLPGINSDPTSTEISDKPANAIVLAMVIFAGVGLLWLLLKNRR